LPKISEADLDKAERDIRELARSGQIKLFICLHIEFSGGFSHFEVEDILLMPFKNIAAKRAGSVEFVFSASFCRLLLKFWIDPQVSKMNGQS
jgi:hypothetical protein